MSTPLGSSHIADRRFAWLGIALVAVGLACHLLAAQAIGGTHVDYRDHIAGFVIVGVLTGVILALLGLRFWRGRRDITLLLFGIIQAAFGVFVYVERFSVHA